MESEDHEGLAQDLAREADRLADESARLEGEIKDVRSDWRAKQNDEGVPGAVKPPEDPAGDDDSAGDDPDRDRKDESNPKDDSAGDDDSDRKDDSET